MRDDVAIAIGIFLLILLILFILSMIGWEKWSADLAVDGTLLHDAGDWV